MKHTYDIRCARAGASCRLHGRRVRASTPRAAMTAVVDPTWFGPLHRVNAHSTERVAYVNESVPYLAHTKHGAIYVRQVGELLS